MVKKSISAIILLMTVLIVLSVGIAGCTSQTPAASPTPETTKTVSTIEPSEMIVQPSEIPGNFTLVTERERTASELSEWALDHGWKKGYSVVYRKNDPNSPSGTIIQQNISSLSAVFGLFTEVFVPLAFSFFSVFTASGCSFAGCSGTGGVTGTGGCPGSSASLVV